MWACGEIGITMICDETKKIRSDMWDAHMRWLYPTSCVWCHIMDTRKIEPHNWNGSLGRLAHSGERLPCTQKAPSSILGTSNMVIG